MGAPSKSTSRDAVTGVLLLNLGTPDSPKTRDVRRYLREFLSDPRVLDMHPWLRTILLYGVILPSRPRRSVAAYRKIWSQEGSPLLAAGRALREAVAETLGPDFEVALGMRYGSPSIAEAVAQLAARGVGRIVALPLFPQYADASTGSALARLFEATGELGVDAEIRTIGAFYQDPRFVEAWRAVAAEPLAEVRADHVVLSYHGLPEHHVRRADPSSCLEREGCCAIAGAAARGCYRAQCFATSRALVDALGLDPEKTSTSFQSRLGRRPWIRPHTDEHLVELADRGVKRLAILCPAFAADCLETLEEAAIGFRERWLELGGEVCWVSPCPNAHPAWVAGVASMVREAAAPPFDRDARPA